MASSIGYWTTGLGWARVTYDLAALAWLGRVAVAIAVVWQVCKADGGVAAAVGRRRRRGRREQLAIFLDDLTIFL